MEPPTSESTERSHHDPACRPRTFAFGRYEVRRMLREGTWKRVYLAHDTHLDRDVALALLKAQQLDEAGMHQLHAECQLLARLSDHPHIVTICDVGEQDGYPYIVSERVAGASLGELFATRSGTPGVEGSTAYWGSPLSGESADLPGLPLDQAIRIAGHIWQALEYAHAHGVVHGDLKPGHVWLTKDGIAKLGGFAPITLLSHWDAAEPPVGAVDHRAPELRFGQAPDSRSDFYGFGTLVYELVTGRRPFVGNAGVTVFDQHDRTPAAPSLNTQGVPPALDELIASLLAEAPEDRPESAAAVREALASCYTAALASVATPVRSSHSTALAPSTNFAPTLCWESGRHLSVVADGGTRRRSVLNGSCVSVLRSERGEAGRCIAGVVLQGTSLQTSVASAGGWSLPVADQITRRITRALVANPFVCAQGARGLMEEVSRRGAHGFTAEDVALFGAVVESLEVMAGKTLEERKPEATQPVRSVQQPFATHQAVFYKEGDYWTIIYAQTVLRLKDSRGLRYIAYLLRYPSREFHASDLVTQITSVADQVSASGINQRLAASSERPSPQPVLDAKAKAAYKQRLDDLRSELEEAERFNDLGRRARTRAEMEFIGNQLAAAVGLHGKDRMAACHAERARLAVTKAIKTAIQRIRDGNPALARHLANTVTTGYFCAYCPDHDVAVSWRL